MKGIVCICLFAVVATALARPDGKYTTKYDNFNTQEVLDNNRLLDAYILCLLDGGKCTAEGNELKGVIKDALETHCEKCNEHQKKEAKKVIHFLIQNKKEAWNKLCDKYDPDRKYSKKYEDELAEIKH